MDSFVFYNPTRIVFGVGSLKKLSKEFSNLAYKKPLLVIGKKSAQQNGVLDKVLNLLKKIEVTAVLFEGITPNPTYLQIDEAASMAKINRCDSIIALGGGSVMDAAKAVALVVAQGNSSWDYTGTFLKKGEAVKKALPIITISTVAATGSEADPIAVISHPTKKEKRSLSGLALYPKVTIVDAELTLTCPLNTTTDGLVDIISHAIETYFSVDKTTPIQDGITETCCKVVKKYGQILINDLNNIEARNQISWASTLVMSGFLSGRNGGWPMHAMEHLVSAHYPSISHGQGLAALMVPVIKWGAYQYGVKKLAQFCKAVFEIEISDIPQGIHLLKELLIKLKAYTNLNKLGVKEPDLEKMTDGVMTAKQNSKKEIINIVPMKHADVLAVFKEAYTF